MKNKHFSNNLILHNRNKKYYKKNLMKIKKHKKPFKKIFKNN